MIDLLFIYCGFMFLFGAGFTYGYVASNDLDDYDKVCLTLTVITAPLVIPFVFGIVYCNENF